MRPAAWSLAYLYSRTSHVAAPASGEVPLAPIEPGKWAAWARRAAAESTESQAPAAAARRRTALRGTEG